MKRNIPPLRNSSPATTAFPPCLKSIAGPLHQPTCWLALASALGLMVISCGCQKVPESGEATPIRVENGQIIVAAGSSASGSILVESSTPPAPASLVLNPPLLWAHNATTHPSPPLPRPAPT